MGPIEHTRYVLYSRLPPRRGIEALVDFSDRRPQIWTETCDPKVYRVHSVGTSDAEVTEGVSYAWSRERYDWSQPGIVTLDQLESNVALPGGRIRYSVLPFGEGSRIECDRRRIFRGIRGRLAGTVMVLLGAPILRRQLAVGLRRYERLTGPPSDIPGGVLG